MATNNSINSVIIGSASKTAFGEMLVAAPDTIVQLSFPYNINAEYVTTTVTGSGTVTQANGMSVISSGAASSSSAMLQSTYRLHYQPGQGAVSLFTAVFTAGVTGNTQISGIGNTQDGFFFGFNGASFGILHRNNSVNTWIAQSSWNGDKLDGSTGTTFTIDPTKGNVYKVQYQWLGFGAIKFYVENPLNGEFILCHTIQYANANVTPSIRNPSLQLMSQSSNTSNTSNIVINNASMCGYIEGKVNNIDIRFSIGNNKSVTTLLNILTLKNNTTYQGVTNQITTYPGVISLYNASGGGNDGVVFIYKNATLGGTPSYTNINANTSVSSYDVAGTTVSNGREVYRFFIGSSQTVSIDLTDNLLRLAPGETLTFAGQSISGTSSIYIGISWQERF